MKNINDLNEDCLIWLFGKFSLQELIELRKVCQLWTVIIEQIFARKKSLRLFGSLKQLANYAEKLFKYQLHSDEYQQLKPVGKDDPMVNYFWIDDVFLFPNVQSLVYYESPDKFDAVFQAMPGITHLSLGTIFKNDDFGEIQESLKEILEKLNKFNSLKHLDLNLDNLDEDFPEIKILSKLESFSFSNYNGVYSTIFKQLGDGLRKLSLDAYVELNDFEKLLKIKPNKFEQLTHLSIQNFINSDITDVKKLFHLICDNFSSLQNLKFGSIESFKQDETVFSLAKLKNLTTLSVDEMWIVENSFLKEKLMQIRSLQISFYSHFEDFPKIDIKSIFFNLDSLTIWAYNDELLKLSKCYLVDKLKLTCKVNLNLNHVDRMFYMGEYGVEYEFEEWIKMQRIQEDFARQEYLNQY